MLNVNIINIIINNNQLIIIIMAGSCIFIFYFVLNFFTIISLINLSDNFFERFSLIFHLIFFPTVVISYLFIIFLRRNPGVVLKDDNNHINNNLTELNTNSSLNTTMDTITNENVNINSNEYNRMIESIDFNEMFKEECRICNTNIVIIVDIN